MTLYAVPAPYYDPPLGSGSSNDEIECSLSGAAVEGQVGYANLRMGSLSSLAGAQSVRLSITIPRSTIGLAAMNPDGQPGVVLTQDRPSTKEWFVPVVAVNTSFSIQLPFTPQAHGSFRISFGVRTAAMAKFMEVEADVPIAASGGNPSS